MARTDRHSEAITRHQGCPAVSSVHRRAHKQVISEVFATVIAEEAVLNHRGKAGGKGSSGVQLLSHLRWNLLLDAERTLGTWETVKQGANEGGRSYNLSQVLSMLLDMFFNNSSPTRFIYVGVPIIHIALSYCNPSHLLFPSLFVAPLASSGLGIRCYSC